MKVLFISSGNAKNGISPLVKNQGKSLQEKGIQIDFFTITGKGLKGYLNGIYRLRRNLRNTPYDLLHAHYGWSGIVAFLSNRRIPIVVSFMGDDVLGSNSQNGNLKKYSIIFIKINRLLALKYYDQIIVKSQEMYDRLAVSKSHIIPNGVDLRCFFPINSEEARKELKFSTEEIIIVFIANPQRPEKNYALAKKAVELLNNPNVRLLAIYNKNQKEINLLLNASDLLILTSFHEGSPNIIKEAMACNCPIVATDVGDIRKVFQNTTGCYIGSFDPDKFSKKISEALEFSLHRGASDGRQRIIDLNLDTNSVAGKIISIYNEALSK